MIYLDHNATTPVVPEARAAVAAALETAWANPSSSHAAGKLARKLVEAARYDVSGTLGVATERVIFESGATEAINHAIAAAGPGRVLVSAVEHPAVWAALDVRPDRTVEVLPVNRAGHVDVAQVLAAVDAGPKPALAAVMAANNETGVCQPVRELAPALAERGVPFLVDAVQYAGKKDLTGLDVDYLVCSAHKLGGPKGAGALVLRADARPAPLIVGGGQELGLRCGTESVPAIAGFGAAMRRVLEHREEDSARIEALRDKLQNGLLDALDGLQVVGHDAPERLPNTLSVILPEGSEAEPVMTRLDRAGIAVSAGSACHAGSLKPSKVLTAMGYAPAESFRALRISLGYGNDDAQIDRVLELLPRFAQEVADW